MNTTKVKAQAASAKTIAGKPGSSTAAELAVLTETTTKLINKLAEYVTKAWVDIGKHVHQYVEDVKATGYKKDSYKLLADADDSFHSFAQLRNFEACYLLWEKLGGAAAPDGLHDSLRCGAGAGNPVREKRTLLELAAEQNWSVSKLRTVVRGKTGTGAAPLDNVANDAIDLDGDEAEDSTPGVAAIQIEWSVQLDTETVEALKKFKSLAELMKDEPVPPTPNTNSWR